ncbi:MAG: trans-sulfuration enzyme family protein [Candidatus Kariarchaeaceae archaeon]|jgi:methionine-gamma-lyase
MADKPREKGFETKAVEPEDIKGPVHALATPIFSNSTYRLESAAHGARLSSRADLEEGDSPWLYSRWGNPTTEIAARVLTKLEGGHESFVMSSGMAAVSTALLSHLQAGDHVIAPNQVYGGTHELFKTTLPSYGVEVSWVDGTQISQYRDAIRDNTRVIYGETPANPTMTICDLDGLGSISAETGITSMVDSTFGSPYNQLPISHGVNVVIHSATKYLGGHSDIIAGSVTVDNESSEKKVFQMLKLLGGVQSPFDAFLLTRGMKSLAVRMRQHNENAQAIAEYLAGHDKIQAVHYPGLENHPQHALATAQMRGYGGMLSFDVKGGVDAGKSVIENLKIINHAVSLGGVESLIVHAPSTTHTMVAREARLQAGITDGLIRFSVGIETLEDLIEDLDQALSGL